MKHIYQAEITDPTDGQVKVIRADSDALLDEKVNRFIAGEPADDDTTTVPPAATALPPRTQLDDLLDAQLDYDSTDGGMKELRGKLAAPGLSDTDRTALTMRRIAAEHLDVYRREQAAVMPKGLPGKDRTVMKLAVAREIIARQQSFAAGEMHVLGEITPVTLARLNAALADAAALDATLADQTGAGEAWRFGHPTLVAEVTDGAAPWIKYARPVMPGDLPIVSSILTGGNLTTTLSQDAANGTVITVTGAPAATSTAVTGLWRYGYRTAGDPASGTFTITHAPDQRAWAKSA